MKIIICGSISACEEIMEVQKQLQEKGHEVEIPTGCKVDHLRGRTEVSAEEKADDKIKYDLIRAYYEKIKQYDVVLVVNQTKHGIKGYIGGNTFLEMGFAHVLNKTIFLFHEMPEMSYTPEIMAMQPMQLHENLDGLKFNT